MLSLLLLTTIAYCVYVLLSNIKNYSNAPKPIPVYVKPTDSKGKINDVTSSEGSSGSSLAPTSITFSTASQDTPGGPLLIRTIVNNSNSGDCSYQLKGDGELKTYSNTLTFSGTYYSCNYNVPYLDLFNSTWQVTVTSGQGSATTNTVVRGS